MAAIQAVLRECEAMGRNCCQSPAGGQESGRFEDKSVRALSGRMHNHAVLGKQGYLALISAQTVVAL